LDTAATIAVSIVFRGLRMLGKGLLQREMRGIAQTSQISSLSKWREYPSLKARTTMAIFWEE
jgi:hypothetical protein